MTRPRTTPLAPLALLIAAPALAQQEIPPERSAEAIPPARDLFGPTRFEIRGAATFNLNADLDGEGEASVSRLGAGATASVSVNPDVLMRLSYDVEFSFYDFDNATQLISDGDPVDSTYEHTLSASLAGQFSPSWGWFGGGGVKIAAETGANANDIYRPLGFGGVRYRFSDALTVGAGVGVVSRFEDSTRFLPLITVDWQINQRWRFSSGRTIITEGPTAAIYYQAREDVELFAGAVYNSREFRMDDEGPVPNGVFRDQRVPIFAGVQWDPTPNIQLVAAGGVTVYQQYEILDDGGDKVSDDESDPTGLFYVRLSASF